MQIERLQEFRDFDRLGQVPEKTRLQPLLDIARHGVGAERNDRDMRGDGISGLRNVQAADQIPEAGKYSPILIQ